MTQAVPKHPVAAALPPIPLGPVPAAPGDAAPLPPGAGEVSPQEFLNRDLSWLEFNRRVLHEALDPRTPLLERLRFLGIFTTNLDEYFMKRVGALKRQIAEGTVTQTPDRLTPAQNLASIRQAISPMLAQQADAFINVICPALSAVGVHLLSWEELTEAEREKSTRYFRANVFPVLTPLAVDPGNPFPFISNLSTSFGVVLHHPDRHEKLFARVKVPEVLPAWVRLDSPSDTSPTRFVSLHELIRHNLDDLFPDMAIVDVMRFRVTRNADVERDEEEAEDLLELVEEELRQRRFANVVRLEIAAREKNGWILEFLVRELQITTDDVYEMQSELDYDDLRP